MHELIRVTAPCRHKRGTVFGSSIKRWFSASLPRRLQPVWVESGRQDSDSRCTIRDFRCTTRAQTRRSNPLAYKVSGLRGLTVLSVGPRRSLPTDDRQACYRIEHLKRAGAEAMTGKHVLRGPRRLSRCRLIPDSEIRLKQ